jgi:hypothetical protein
MAVVTTIRRNPESALDLIDWWEEEDLEDDVEVMLGPAEVALFVRNDEVLLQLPAGRHALTAEAYPVLEEWLAGDDEDVAIAFINATFYADVEVSSDYTWGEEDEANVKTTATVHVTDPVKVLDVLQHLGDDESLEDWLGDEIATHLVAAILALDVPDVLHVTSQAHDMDLQETAKVDSNEVLGAYGIQVDRIEDLVHELDPATLKRIKAALLRNA